MEATVNMLKVAFIGDVLFPIPDIKGGAISTLVTGIINENEKLLPKHIGITKESELYKLQG